MAATQKDGPAAQWTVAEFEALESSVRTYCRDDIQVGCGRTGAFFSFERAGIKPDIICLSKAIGGIGMPMALTLMKPECDLWGPGDHVGTFRGNNLAFVAASAALDYWRTPDLEKILDQRSRKIRQHLVRVADRYPDHCAGARGIGMIQGLAWRDPTLTQAILRAAFERGLLIESCGPNSEVLKLLPPLIISDDELEEGLAFLSDAIDHTMESVSERRVIQSE